MDKKIIIKPLNSVFKINKVIRLISLVFIFPIILGYFTGGNIYLLSVELIIFLGIFLYETIKLNKLKKSIYIVENEKILINGIVYSIEDLFFELDNHGNLLIINNNMHIAKIYRLSYNIEFLKERLIKNIK